MGSSSMLSKVMAAFARPTRLVSSQAMDADAQVDEQLFEVEEERQLLASYQRVASKVALCTPYAWRLLFHFRCARLMLFGVITDKLNCGANYTRSAVLYCLQTLNPILNYLSM